MRTAATLTLVLLTFSAPAAADVVNPAQIECNGKKAGDACASGVCAESFECGNGACRRFSDEAACKAEAGCSWQSRLYCKPGTPATKPSSCAASSTAGAALLALAAFLRRRRR
jgi:MYXO-CTERM domain-containing protein